MNIIHLYSKRLIPILIAGALPLAAHAALSSTASHKLDKRLAVIATAVQANRAEPMMTAALSREIYQQNSPLEARWNAAGQVQVYLHYNRDGNPPDTSALAALGATDILSSPALGVVQAWIPANKLVDAAALSTVTRVSIPQYALVRRSSLNTVLPRTGSVDTQGDQILGAAQFRATTGYTGQGIVVGVMSDGDSGVSTSQGTGDLPSNIWDNPNNSSWGSSGAEGTAMMEIVYDLAPGVKQLGFAGPGTTTEFLTALNNFSSAIDANVIVDDLGFLGESVFSNGAFATGVANFAASNPDVHLVTAAGNDASAFWAGTWNPDTLTTPITINNATYTEAMNFGAYSSSPSGCNAPPGIGQPLCFYVQGSNQQPGGDTILYTVIWDNPWDDTDNTDLGANYVSPSDYDVVLFDATGNAIACNQGENVSTSNGLCSYSTSLPLDDPGPTPIQGNQWQNSDTNAVPVYLQIFYVKDSTPLTRNFKVLISSLNSWVTQVNPNTPAGSIYGHSAVGVPEPSTMTPGEITVGAVEPSSPYSIESYSSQGPVQFSTNGQSQGTIQKPDFVAPNCVNVTGAGGFGSPFCGTSAAAPHIAGLMALLLSAYPNGDDPYTLLQQSATSLGNAPYPNGVYGYGLPNLNTLLTSGTYPDTAATITSPASGASITGGQSTTFEGQCLGYDGSTNFTYLWNFGTSAIPNSNAHNPAVTYNTAGTYTVTLTCTNNVGSGSTTSSITVTGPRFGAAGSFGFLTLAMLVLMQLALIRRRIRATRT